MIIDKRLIFVKERENRSGTDLLIDSSAQLSMVAMAILPVMSHNLLTKSQTYNFINYA